MIIHPFKPVFDENSKILILGSFPSPASREVNFYFGHKQNRFWRVLSDLFDEKIADDINSKTQFLLNQHIALWDVVYSCEITKAADSKIKNVTVNDFSKIFNKTGNIPVFTLGNTATKLYKKHTGEDSIKLPSTSPANCKLSYNELLKAFSIILNYLK